MGFGQKVGSSLLRFGAKAVGAGAKFGSKVASTVGRTVTSVTTPVKSVLDFGSIIPGVNLVAAPLAAGANVIHGIGGALNQAGEALNYISKGAESIEKRVGK
jgi:hypothetical protein